MFGMIDNKHPHYQFIEICLCLRDEESGGGGGGILIYPCPFVRLFVRPDIDTWFVQLSPSTVLVFRRIFIHIMEVCMSTGF